MKWKGINNQKELRPYLFSRAGISGFSFTRFGESLLMQFLVKGKGSPFKKEEGIIPPQNQIRAKIKRIGFNVKGD